MRRSGREAALVPSGGPSGRALAGVVAILSFLASLAALAGIAVSERAADWRDATAREATIQVVPQPNRDPDADLARAATIARGVPGIAEVRVLTRGAAEHLLEPWLGRGLDLAQLPVPRLAVLVFAEGRAPDMAGLARQLAAATPTATLDDHARWLARLTAAADAAVALALAAVLLVMTATGLAVGFATRGAVATAREVVEVLHLMGADDAFIARLFARRSLDVVLRGALLGTLAAGLAALVVRWLIADGGEYAAALSSGLHAIGWRDLVALAFIPLASAGLASSISAGAVKRFLRQDHAS